MAASYPAAIWTPITKTDKVDLVLAEHMNRAQEEIVAVQTELAANVAGSATDLVARLAKALADNGAIQQGTSFPTVDLVDGQMFYRTDQNVLYIYNGSSWDAQGQSLTDVVFSFALMGSSYQVDAYGVLVSDNIEGASVVQTDITGMVWAVRNTTYRTIISSKYHKLPGQNTITVYALVGASTGGTVHVQVDIGGQNGSASRAATSYDWVNFTVDVSSLSDGTVYDVAIQLKNATDTSNFLGLMKSIIGFAS